MLRPRPTGRPLVLLVDDAHHLSLDDDALKDDALDGFGHGRLVLLLRGDRAADGRARAAEAQVRRRRGGDGAVGVELEVERALAAVFPVLLVKPGRVVEPVYY